MNFLALMALRTPQARGMMSRAPAARMRAIAKQMVPAPETFIAMAERARAAGKDIPAETDFAAEYEVVKQVVEEGHLEVVIPKEWYVKTMFEMVDAILQPLADRKWNSLVSDGSAYFAV